ncbi:MAG: hypothetical protein ACREQ9_15145 [Candidatus Binatia bacterium]
MRCEILRPDGSILPAWEMFVSERSYGRSNSKHALLRSWEARLEEAEHGRPFAFRPMQKRMQKPERSGGMKRTDEKGARAANAGRPAPAPPAAKRSRS